MPATVLNLAHTSGADARRSAQRTGPPDHCSTQRGNGKTSDEWVKKHRGCHTTRDGAPKDASKILGN